MASLITPQFERYVAEQTIARGTVQFDEFIFANIPGLNENNLAQHLTIPTSAQIVHRQSVSQSGVINENAVVYSVTIGTEVGDFDFNFIGLINKSKNMLAVAVQTAPIKKIRNKNAVQGNSITRNILLEFTGAKALTGINVNANTWQIDFTVRLHGLDEKIRLTNRDLYGRAVFFDDGFLVKRKTGNQFTIQPGVAYVEGVRMDLTALYNLTANNLPCSVYADVVHHCTVTGEYQTEIKYLTQSKTDYADTANRQHYVQILADIDSQGNVTDRRLLSPFLGMNPLTLDDTTENTKDKRGHTHKLPIASLVKKGIVKLFSGYDSDTEDMAATPKAIKGLKALIDAITRNLGNYIPNSKKSSRVDSNSADDVATSAAVKTAYDKGVEAETAADNANKNADGRVSKSGDTMTGNLLLKQGDYSGLNLYNNDGYYTRLEGNPHNNNSLLTLVYRTPQGANIAAVSLPKKNGVIAYAGDVVSINGDSMLGTLSFSGATDSYRIGSYTWRMPIRFSGDAVIGNEKCVIGFNNNGALHFGGLPNASQFNATLDGEKFWVAGDVKTALGRSLNNSIYKEGESHDIALSWLSDGLKVRLDKTDLGRVAFKHDIGKSQLVWQGEMSNALTVTLPVDRGILFVCVTKSWGAGTIFNLWLSAPIEHCDNTRLGDQDAGGSGGDYDFTMALLLNKSGRSLKLTPEGARKPIIKKIVVVGA
nr:MAG TPA: Tail fiber protein [Caudoviricetes sp.]